MIDRNGVFWKQRFDYGIAFISHLMNSDGKFLTLKEFQSRFEIKVNYFHYFQLIAAIPPDLKRRHLVSRFLIYLTQRQSTVR